MRLKKYETSEVESAVKQARSELGEEAMLVSIERAPASQVGMGRYRVIFAAESFATVEKLPKTANNGLFQMGISPSKWDIVRVELRELASDLSRFTSEDILEPSKKPLSATADHAGQNRQKDQAGTFQPMVLPLIEALVGPTKSGKSTAISKLALSQAKAGKKVALIRLFQPEKTLESELSSNGVIECYAESISHLDAVVDVEPWMDSILVDITRAGEEIRDPLLRWLTDRQAFVHLTLDACVKPEEWLEARIAFNSFSPDHLLLTHVDLITDWAAVWRGIGGTCLPCSYFSAGPRLSSPLDFIGRAQTAQPETGKAASA